LKRTFATIAARKGVHKTSRDNPIFVLRKGFLANKGFLIIMFTCLANKAGMAETRIFGNISFAKQDFNEI